MPAKHVIQGDEARESLMRGVNMVAEAVRLTLGPKCKNVVLERKWGAPVITNDGAKIVKEVDLPDSFENMGAQLIKEAANKTNDIAGDGTTTSTVLAQIMVREGMKNVAAGSDPMAIKRGIDKCVEVIVAELEKLSTSVEGRDQMAQIASISANDTEIGEMMADVIDKTGADGVITVEEGKGFVSETEFVEGMNFDRGYISPYFVTDQERMESKIEDPYILVTDKKISSVAELVPILEKTMQISKNLVVIVLFKFIAVTALVATVSAESLLARATTVVIGEPDIPEDVKIRFALPTVIVETTTTAVSTWLVPIFSKVPKASKFAIIYSYPFCPISTSVDRLNVLVSGSKSPRVFTINELPTVT